MCQHWSTGDVCALKLGDWLMLGFHTCPCAPTEVQTRCSAADAAAESGSDTLSLLHSVSAYLKQIKLRYY